MEEDAVEVDADAVEGGGSEGELGGEVVVGGDAGKALDGAERVVGEDAGEIAELGAGEVQVGLGGEGAGLDLDGFGAAEGFGDEADFEVCGFGGELEGELAVADAGDFEVTGLGIEFEAAFGGGGGLGAGFEEGAMDGLVGDGVEDASANGGGRECGG